MIGLINNPLKRNESPRIMSIEEMVFPPIRNRAPSVDPILISVIVYERKVGRVLLDEGATCDIIYEHCFLKLRKEVRERKKDVYTTLFGCSGEQVNPLGDISLQIPVGEAPHHRSKQITFLISTNKMKTRKVTPIQQKQRGMALERSAAASKEVEELRKAGILCETRYQTWVANTVMVKKTNEA
ncbi:hypothetical protein Tco_1318167 [Tanacetum coccineum]